MKLSNIGYVILWSRDVEKSLAFYRDVLGCTIKMANPHWSEIDCGTTTLALHGLDEAAQKKFGSGTPAGGLPSEVVFSVDDIKGAHATLKDRGVAFLGDPHVVCEVPGGVGMAASFKDPDGHGLSIFGIVMNA